MANIAYGERADVAMPVIQNKIRELEGALLEQAVAVDAAAKEVPSPFLLPTHYILVHGIV